MFCSVRGRVRSGTAAAFRKSPKEKYGEYVADSEARTLILDVHFAAMLNAPETSDATSWGTTEKYRPLPATDALRSTLSFRRRYTKAPLAIANALFWLNRG